MRFLGDSFICKFCASLEGHSFQGLHPTSQTEDKSAANELFGAADMVSLKTEVSETAYPSIALMALCGCFAQTSLLSLLTVSPQKIIDCCHVGCFPFDF